MYVNWDKRKVYLYNDNGAILRQFKATADIVNASVSGTGENSTVAIVMSNRCTDVYHSNGRLMHRIKARR